MTISLRDTSWYEEWVSFLGGPVVSTRSISLPCGHWRTPPLLSDGARWGQRARGGGGGVGEAPSKSVQRLRKGGGVAHEKSTLRPPPVLPHPPFAF